IFATSTLSSRAARSIIASIGFSDTTAGARGASSRFATAVSGMLLCSLYFTLHKRDEIANGDDFGFFLVRDFDPKFVFQLEYDCHAVETVGSEVRAQVSGVDEAIFLHLAERFQDRGIHAAAKARTTAVDVCEGHDCSP